MKDYDIHLIYGTSFSVRADTYEITDRFIHFYVFIDNKPQIIVSISKSIVFDIPEEV